MSVVTVVKIANLHQKVLASTLNSDSATCYQLFSLLNGLLTITLSSAQEPRILQDFQLQNFGSENSSAI